MPTVDTAELDWAAFLGWCCSFSCCSGFSVGSAAWAGFRILGRPNRAEVRSGIGRRVSNILSRPKATQKPISRDFYGFLVCLKAAQEIAAGAARPEEAVIGTT